MNKHILTVIDNQLNPGKYTRAQLQDNAADADAADADADAAADANAYAYAAAAAADAYAYAYAYAYDAYDAYAYADADAAVYWLNKYFNITGENKQDYIDEINKDNKQ